ncbi:MAG: Rpn family recombination-promoting nuclease/putative transposase [Candidatus Aminicenantes bacterium]|nr:Rpn family recombination-promoting nuclease/putative transposase [Candidatus Aminicenantes bacterium]
MKKIDRIRDKFCKVVLGDTRNTKPVLHLLLPEPIKRSMDWSQITMDPTNYVSKRYREGYSDIVAKTKMKNDQGVLDLDIYFLFEHKSTNEKDTPIQILNYKHLVWAKDISEGKPMRVIIPIVFYYGQEKWTIPLQFIDHFKVANDVKPYLLDFQYILFDATKWDFREEKHRELKNNVFLLTALALMKSTTNEDMESIREIFRFWVERGFLDEKENIIFFMMFISETKKLDMDNLVKILEETNIEGGDMMLTLADRIRKEARKDFIQEGIEEGKKENTWEIIKNAFNLGLPINIIEKLTGIPAEQINLMKEKMAQS